MIATAFLSCETQTIEVEKSAGIANNDGEKYVFGSDEDSKKYIKIFTFETKEFIEDLIDQHVKAPHERILQKFIASELTKMVHSEEDLEKVLNASNILFSK